MKRAQDIRADNDLLAGARPDVTSTPGYEDSLRTASAGKCDRGAACSCRQHVLVLLLGVVPLTLPQASLMRVWLVGRAAVARRRVAHSGSAASWSRCTSL